LDNGKPFTQSYGDIGGAAEMLRYFGGLADKIVGQTIPASKHLCPLYVQYYMRLICRISMEVHESSGNRPIEWCVAEERIKFVLTFTRNRGSAKHYYQGRRSIRARRKAVLWVFWLTIAFGLQFDDCFHFSAGGFVAEHGKACC
jgi:hypothetical protein